MYPARVVSVILSVWHANIQGFCWSDVIFFQPLTHLCSLSPASNVAPSTAVMIVLFIAISVASFVAVWSLGESSCTPALTDSRGILLEVFIAVNGWTQDTVTVGPADMSS